MVAQILAALVIGLEQAQRVPTLLSQTPRSDVYRVCRIFNGRLSYCGRWFTGETVLWHNNSYRTCRLFNGRLSYCGRWFTGETVLWHNNSYRTCHIFNGRLSYCGRWFTGETVLPEPRRQLILAARRDTIPVALALVAGSRFGGDRPAEFVG